MFYFWQEVLYPSQSNTDPPQHPKLSDSWALHAANVNVKIKRCYGRFILFLQLILCGQRVQNKLTIFWGFCNVQLCNCAESNSKNNSAPFSTSSKFKSHQNKKLQQSQRRRWRLWAQSWASTSSLGGNFLALLLQLRNSPIAPSIVAELIVVCSFSVGVQACSCLTSDCTLKWTAYILQTAIC